MPRKHEFKSLAKLCMKYIKETIENSKFVGDLPRILKYSDEIVVSSEMSNNPFHQLPVTVLEEIVLLLTRRQKLTDAKILEHIITPLIRHLSFSLYCDDYLILFPKFGNLLILDLKKTIVGNNSLKSIATYCFKLRWLNLEDCFNVTDNGIKWLCNGGNYPEMGYGKPRLCKTLQELNVICTSVTQKGIQVALRYLFSLKVINSYNTFDALVELAQLAKDSNRPGLYNDKFSISILYTPRDHPISSESIRLALSLCNLVNRVAIHATEGLKDSDLLCLLSLNHLYGLLILKSSSKSEITFDGGVVPLLKTFGKSLGILSFQHFDSVRISTIAEFCPNLTSLKVNYKARQLLRGGSSVDNESDILLMKDKLPLFKNLKTLFCEGDIQPDILLCLLSSPLLHRLIVHYCETFSDEVLQKAADFHGFQNLQVLDLVGCNSVSKRGIEALLVDSNPLNKINLYFCKNLSSCEWLRSMIVRRNWNVECMLINDSFA